MSHSWIKKYLQNPFRVLNSCWINQTRWCIHFLYFRKEEWLINWTETMNSCHIILIQHNYSFMNWEIIISETLINKLINKKKVKIPSSPLLKLNSSIFYLIKKKISPIRIKQTCSWRKIISWKTHLNLCQSFKSR